MYIPSHILLRLLHFKTKYSKSISMAKLKQHKWQPYDYSVTARLWICFSFLSRNNSSVLFLKLDQAEYIKLMTSWVSYMQTQHLRNKAHATVNTTILIRLYCKFTMHPIKRSMKRKESLSLPCTSWWFSLDWQNRKNTRGAITSRLKKNCRLAA